MLKFKLLLKFYLIIYINLLIYLESIFGVNIGIIPSKN
jgi:hypothetical protein